MGETMADQQPILTSRSLSPEEVRKRTKIAEDFYSVFSNHVRVAASVTEFRLFFGENYPTATGEIEVIENFSIVLTPAQAKSMSSLLAETIQKIEALYGAIRDIRSLQKTETPQPATPATERQD